MNAFERFFHGPHALARSELFGRGLLLLLACDVWLILIRVAGRHGVVDFNVAHFGWLDALLPVPSAGFATGLLIASGLLACASALGGLRRAPLLALFALYSLAWSMSMIDSYQHHYLLSLVLLCLVFFPRGERDGGHTGFASGFGVGLLLATVAIVYVYTAVAKLDADWLLGNTLRRVGQVEERLGRLADLTATAGLGRDRFFALAASLVIPLELFLAFAYALAARRDHLARPWVGRISAVAFVAAVALHAGIDSVDPLIGLFGFYMLGLAVCFLLPLRLVEPLAGALLRPLRKLVSRGDRAVGRARRRRLLALAAAVALGLSAVGGSLELPGALAACGLVGAALVATASFAVYGPTPRDPTPAIRATALAGLALWASMATSSVRWDFYRHRARELASVGAFAASLEACRAAERHAPAGHDLAPEIAALERELAAGEARVRP